MAVVKSEKWLRNVLIETAYLREGTFTSGSQTKLIDVQIKDGVVAQIKEYQPEQFYESEIDGKGRLLLPTLKEMHCHLDKSKLGVPWRPVTPAQNIVERFTSEVAELDALDLSIEARAKNLINLELAHGVTFFRSHIDVHPAVGQRYLEGVQRAIASYDERFDYELIAFPQHGLLRSNAYNEVDTALKNGATLIGGVDPYSLDGDVEKSLNQTFELAVKHHVPIDIHVHDRGEAGRATFKTLLDYTKQSNWQGQVFVSHAFGLNDFLGEERADVFAQLAKERIGIISSVPINGAVPPLKELQQAGVKVALGCDNIYDSWSPYGTGSVVEKLNRYGEVFNLKTQEELTESLGLLTGGTKTLSTEEDGLWLKTGDVASFLLTEASCAAEFVARQTPVETSFYRGQVAFNS
ncbi:deaminase [Enterococcus sp. JM4C]|uniref:amidohydrolase n=1 Tax=Candidatus Enterococcus huntleyi TaxID=1857217 RepID=UPI00137ADD70|nr:amidohydrolase [Enterococcus sp. JM4C]KAF1296427.1 deaminase [Enterococcus sp. JM4C]